MIVVTLHLCFVVRVDYYATIVVYMLHARAHTHTRTHTHTHTRMTLGINGKISTQIKLKGDFFAHCTFSYSSVYGVINIDLSSLLIQFCLID